MNVPCLFAACEESFSPQPLQKLADCSKMLWSQCEHFIFKLQKSLQKGEPVFTSVPNPKDNPFQLCDQLGNNHVQNVSVMWTLKYKIA